MAHPLPRYSPSGFFRPIAIALFLAAIALGCVLAFLYQATVRWISIVQVKMLVVLVFAAMLGGAGAWAVRKGHCRNRLIALLFALALAGVPLAATYYWDYALAEPGNVRFRLGEHGLSAEYTFRDYLEDRQRHGWRMKSGGDVTGAGVLTMWTLEALVVFGAVLALTVPGAADPYCERCSRFCDSSGFTVRGLGRAAADPLLASGALDRVIDLEAPADGDAALALQLSVTSCPQCKETAFLTVSEVRTVVKKNKTRQKTTRLVRYAVLSTQNREHAFARLTNVRGQTLPAVR